MDAIERRIFMKYHERIKEIRIEKGFTQKQIADLLNIDLAEYCKYEDGRVVLSANKLREFCKITNVSSNYILGLPHNMKYPKDRK